MFTWNFPYVIILIENKDMIDGDNMLFKKAILIIHGFAGGTYDQEELANYLRLNKKFDVFQFTLLGHDRNLSKVKHLEWIEASEKQLEWLIGKGYKSIYLIGHSMGGVIATYLVSKYKEVKKLVLAAPAFQYLNVVKEDLNVKDSLKVAPKVIKTYGSDEIVARFLKLNIVVLKEFMDLVKEYYDYPKAVKCPVLIIQGKNDNLVSIESSKYVYDSVKSRTKKIVFVDELTHDVFRNINKYDIFNLVEKFLKYNQIGGEYNI